MLQVKNETQCFDPRMQLKNDQHCFDLPAFGFAQSLISGCWTEEVPLSEPPMCLAAELQMCSLSSPQILLRFLSVLGVLQIVSLSRIGSDSAHDILSRLISEEAKLLCLEPYLCLALI